MGAAKPAAERAPSTAQLVANRTNALRSTGPRTAEGKEKVARNALKHGLCSPRLGLLHDEDPAELVEFHQRLFDHLDPRDPMEELLVERIISQAWRLRRIIRIERDIFVVGQVEAAEAGEVRLGFAFGRDGRIQDATETLSRYERHLERSFRDLLLDLERGRVGPRSPLGILADRYRETNPTTNTGDQSS